MKTVTPFILTLLSFAGNAFAIDEVILKNGTVVEGKVLSDIPNRHVDLQLVNGTKKRFLQTEVASIERDVPSHKDYDLLGTDSRAFFGFNMGGFLNTSATNTDVQFNWGARFGVNTGQMGDFSRFAVALAYNRTASSSGLISSSINQLMLQALFRRVGNTGFYFGPQLGLALISTDIAGLSTTSSQFDFGALAGYDYHFSQKFSIGPELHFTHYNNNSILKFLLGGTLHFD